MKFIYHPSPTLPRLAWCARLTRGTSVVEVFHGPWVEAHDQFFVEGAWDGEFMAGAIDESACFMGTGGRLRGSQVVFATPSEPLQRLHLLRKDDQLFVSPSLAFVLELAGCSLDLGYIAYQTDFQKFIRELDQHIGEIPLAGGRRLRVIHFRNIHVDSALKVEIIAKPVPLAWSSFRAYEAYLLQALCSLVANAQDPARKQHYHLLGTLSSGYDSSAVTALARDAGCTQAISFKTARMEKALLGENHDDGAVVASHLGMELQLFDRLGYLERTDFPEAEFLASGELGQEVYLTTASEALENSLMITGHHGDQIWDRTGPKPVRTIPRHSSSGCSQTEIQLRVGFIHVPLPFVGASNYPELNKITLSGEMQPWTLGNRYDRPIARRFVEERGVPRDAFAREKKAASVLLNSAQRVESQLSPKSRQAFDKFYAAHRGQRPLWKQWFYSTMYAGYRCYRQLNRLVPLEGALKYVGLPKDLLCPFPRRFREDPGKPSFLVHWGLSVIRSRYAVSARPATDPPAEPAGEPAVAKTF